VSPKRVHEMCDMLDRVFPDKSRFAFFCEGRVNVLGEHPELIHRLREAGMIRIQIGIESGDQTMLDRINKKTRVEQIEKVIATCVDADVRSMPAMFMCGLPGQTEADVQRDIEFAKRLVEMAPGRMELKMVPLALLPGTEFRVHADRWGLCPIDEDFVTDRLHKRALAETSTLSKKQIDDLCDRFNDEVRQYILETAACLSPHRLKELFVQAAELRAQTLVTSTLCLFEHVARILQLRLRDDHRFLFELPVGVAPENCFPQTMLDNSVTESDGGYVVNDKSPLGFDLSTDEMKYYRYLSGKLSFEEIARRVAREEGIPVRQALAAGLAAYEKCEHHLSAILALGPQAFPLAKR